MREISLFLAWKAATRSDAYFEAYEKAMHEGLAESVLLLLRAKFTTVPENLVARIQAGTDREQFGRWILSAAAAATLEQFHNELLLHQERRTKA